MKFIHISDVQLGAVPDAGKPWGKERERERWIVLGEIMEACNKEKVDLLLIAGNLFSRQPLLKELKEVNFLFSRLMHTQVVITAGTLDQLKESSPYYKFPWQSHVHFLQGRWPEKVYLPLLDTEVWGFGIQGKLKGDLLKDFAVEKSQTYRIFLGAHEKNAPAFALESVQGAGFHYVALGGRMHFEKLGETCAFSGTMDPLEKEDTGYHGYVMGEILEEGLHFSFIPCAKRDYVLLKVTVGTDTSAEQLTEKIQEVIRNHGEQHIYRIHLKGKHDPDFPPDTQALWELGNVIEVIDETYPAYDLMAVYKEHKDDIIGKYMEALQTHRQGELDRKALYYGLAALLQE